MIGPCPARKGACRRRRSVAVASRVTLDQDVQFVRGVGPVRAAEFTKLGVRTVRDLIEYFPFRHEQIPKSQPIGTLELDEVATVIGSLQRVRTGGRSRSASVSATLVDGTGRCRARWFNSPYLADRIHNGQIVRLSGKVGLYRDLAMLTNPAVDVLDDLEDPLSNDEDRYEPVYYGTAGLPTRQIAKVIDAVLDDAVADVDETLPEAIRVQRALPPRPTAILRYHRPTRLEDVHVARQRLAYDEFLLCQLAVQMGRRQAVGPSSQPIVTGEAVDRRIRGRLPFSLTDGQDRAVTEIRSDLARSVPMNRMLQADVGAGKTAVAVYAALAAIAAGRQVALLAPTEVLASQHLAKIERYLDGSRVRIGYLAGSTTSAARAAMLKALRVGELDWLVGTHALIEPDVRFNDLGLIVIDEQHKFGVEQRAALRGKGRAPHTLVLTATPIPRTLAMTVFGDLDVSTIDGVLPGRKPIVTRLVATDKSGDAWRFVRSRLDAGEQAYVVYPLVEESEAMPLKAATTEMEHLSSSTLAGYRIGLLHGRMRPAEKAEVMARFRAGEIQVLVSTTVIEVGVDVPNATVMVIQHAERYGLSQLHQLRGRIGRGGSKSYCLLFAETEGETSTARLKILCETNDGFRIAEEDLRLRGPGELLGTRQHGLPAFKAADLVTDFEWLEQARDDAAALLRTDPELSKPEHCRLRDALRRQYAGALRLIDVA